MNLMKLIRLKIIGTLKIEKMMAGNFTVRNNIKNALNKITIPCRSVEHGEQIINKIKFSKPGEIICL
ncbi:MAG: hypothetical protein COW65_01250 [Cytophagales bacterium CG18_big_fil_WC_8_21_14_2_50_42_9]|nr:MAG: hypothetical protein COW65_01250 [Cytophagales bacterium CG18_big_fil_WC_8_21_14_2_50_42_9]